MELDSPCLDAYLRQHVNGYRGPLTVRQFSGGQSNPTYLLLTPQKNYVLRRKPPGTLLASAHAVDREFRVLTALHARAEVPVPQPYVLCRDNEVIGGWFYVMEHVQGRFFLDPALPEIPRAERRRYFDAMSSTLAALHQIEPTVVGLQNFGRGTGYLTRQIERWGSQYRQETAAARVPALERLMEWLPANLPSNEPQPALVHGDFKIDNLLFHPTDARIVAVLDWELSTLGDPLADFAYHLMMYAVPTHAIPGLLGRDLRALDIPSQESYIAAYCARTGRAGIPDLGFYMIFCLFRLAAIFHGIRGRIARGNAVSDRAFEYARHVETLADLAWQRAMSL